jgi:CxxC motif-containing protein (DUF1111 family)
LALRTLLDDPTDLPVPGLTAAELQHFNEGNRHFNRLFHAADGLGPLYIRPSCAACHQRDSKGPGAVVKVAVVQDGGQPSPLEATLLPFGNTLRQRLEAGATTPLGPPAPPDGVGAPTVRRSARLGPAIFGRGYLEAVLDSEIERMEAEQAQRSDAIHGRIHRVTFVSETNPTQQVHAFAQGQGGLIGRFGVKARLATLDDFVAEAYQGDMGLTSPLRPNELGNADGRTDDRKPGIDVAASVVNTVADYVRAVNIPDRRFSSNPARARTLFAQTLCGVCHVPTLKSRPDYPVRALAGGELPIFTDLLLHDLGVGLDDGVREGQATGRLWRTAPLMGLRHLQRFLHDGRATTVEQAILAHDSAGSEASGSVAAYRALSPEDRALLLDYVGGL